MANPFFTVGHSTHAIEVFVTLLRDVDVEAVADVRTVPRSRKNPQYNRDVLSRTLGAFELDYTHIPELGGCAPAGPFRRPSTPSGKTRASTIMPTTP
jgi:uncharacterized protein (DUF488 family)